MSAVQTALNILEIFEDILLHMSSTDLLRATQVNKMFKSTIDSSIYLQRALFLQPGNTRDKNDQRIEPQINTMLLPCLGRLYDGHEVQSGNAWEGRLQGLSSMDGFEIPGCRHLALPLTVRRPDEYRESNLPDAGDGSWRKMLLTQPPCTVWVTLPDPELPDDETQFIVVAMEGPGMRDLVEMLKRVYCKGDLEGLKTMEMRVAHPRGGVRRCVQCSDAGKNKDSSNSAAWQLLVILDGVFV